MKKIVCMLLFALWAVPMQASQHIHRHVQHVKKKVRSYHHKYVGLASWYGRQHQGKLMANGDRFNRHKFTAASLWLPLGSRIRVICPTTGKSVDVTVTDRGPHKRGRILDLAEAPARALGMVKEGTITVFFYILPETVLAD